MQRDVRLHFIGIGGAGMSGLARYALEAGFPVSGSDRRRDPALESLAALGATVHLGHDAAHLDGADVVVISSAVPADNAELLAARERGLTVMRRGELLAELVADHPSGIAVCGTHGKGTTAGALVAMLEAAGARVGYILGAPRRATGRRAVYVTDADFLVAEVDESDRTHLAHRPAHLLVNNLEADHLDVYGSLEALVGSFESLVGRFCAERATRGGQCVLGLDGAGMTQLLERLGGGSSAAVTTCALGRAARVEGRALELLPDGTTRFSLARDGATLCEIRSALQGELNARNLVSAGALALALGVEPAVIAQAAGTYTGLVDRFDALSAAGDRLVVTDYTSHPTSIAGNLASLRSRVRGRIHAVFQPYRYSLLSYHWEAYAAALAQADVVYLAPLDAAGEAPLAGISGEALAEAIGARSASVSVRGFGALEALESAAGSALGAGEALIVFGGGPLFEMARRIAVRAGDEGHG